MNAMSHESHSEITLSMRRKLEILVSTGALLSAVFGCAPEAKAPTQAAAEPVAPPRATAAPPKATAATPPAPSSTGYSFVGGYPTPETIQRAYYDADLARAVQAYRFFYPTVSMTAFYKSALQTGAEANKSFFILMATPR